MSTTHLMCRKTDTVPRNIVSCISLYGPRSHEENMDHARLSIRWPWKVNAFNYAAKSIPYGAQNTCRCPKPPTMHLASGMAMVYVVLEWNQCETFAVQEKRSTFLSQTDARRTAVMLFPQCFELSPWTITHCFYRPPGVAHGICWRFGHASDETFECPTRAFNVGFYTGARS